MQNAASLLMPGAHVGQPQLMPQQRIPQMVTSNVTAGGVFGVVVQQQQLLLQQQVPPPPPQQAQQAPLQQQQQQWLLMQQQRRQQQLPSQQGAMRLTSKDLRLHQSMLDSAQNNNKKRVFFSNSAQPQETLVTLPQGWSEHYSEKRQRPFYLNFSTSECKWHKPELRPPPPPPRPPPPVALHAAHSSATAVGLHAAHSTAFTTCTGTKITGKRLRRKLL